MYFTATLQIKAWRHKTPTNTPLDNILSLDKSGDENSNLQRLRSGGSKCGIMTDTDSGHQLDRETPVHRCDTGNVTDSIRV